MNIHPSPRGAASAAASLCASVATAAGTVASARASVAIAASAALLLGALAVASPGFAADRAAAAESDTRADQAAMGTITPRQFAMQAAEGGLAEVQLSELARQQAGSAEVRQFAERMVTDHGKANAELQALAKQKNITLPKTLNAEHATTLKTLQSKRGAEFDTAYMAAMKKDHVSTIALFQAATGPTFDDAELKAFASRTLPLLQEHHQMVERTQRTAREAGQPMR